MKTQIKLLATIFLLNICVNASSHWISEPVASKLLNDSGIIKKNKLIAPRIFAVVVGVADYVGSENDLTYSDDDARLFYNHLKIALPNEMANGSSVLLLNQNATRQNIINSLQDIFSQSNENDFIIFYFILVFFSSYCS